MTGLLEKFRVFRHSRKERPRSSRRPNRERETWLKWVLIGGFVLMGVYFWATTARVLGEPIEVSYGPSDPVFASSLGPLLGAEFTAGNRLQVLVNGDEIFPAMVKAIHEAKYTITLETYIWASGRASDLIIDALTDRARQGVKITALVDGMGALKLSHSDKTRLKEAGVELLKYGREHWYDIKPNVNHRTHRKLLIIDGRVAFTGGVCIDDHWLGNAESKKVWRETQVKLEGPAVRQMQAIFATNWLQTTSTLLVGDHYFPQTKGSGSAAVQCFKSGPNEDPENARISYLMAIASARKMIRISHAYFVPDQLAIDMLLAARKRGVTIQVVVPATNDSRIGRAAARSRWGELLKAGVEFYLYEPAMYHCKVMIVDDVFATVGSVNFDNRSFAINDEANINVLDRDFVRDLTKTFEADRQKSRVLRFEEYDDRSIFVKAFDQVCGLFRSQL
ncbi:MAG: cardiolipin synthase [Nibricoccus sp.]